MLGFDPVRSLAPTLDGFEAADRLIPGDAAQRQTRRLRRVQARRARTSLI